MITGTLRLFSEADLDRLHAAVLRVLERTGMRVRSDEFLDGLAASGAVVDRARQVARFPAAMVEGLIAERRRQPWVPPREQGEPGDYFEHVGSVIAPFYYDYARQERRPATRQDLLDIIHWADVDVQPPVDLAVTMSDVDPRVEPIEGYALLLQHSAHPARRAYTTSADQIPFLLDLSAAYYGQAQFPRGVDFVTSPLTFGDRLARYTLAAIRFGIRHFGIGAMPLCGGNSPMTVAGNVVTATAELVGAWLTIRSLAPDATFGGYPLNGIVDLRKGAASFNAPEALLATLGVCELINRRYGGRSGVAAGSDYIDGALPGIQTAYERAYRAMAIAACLGTPFSLGGDGTLDAGQVFSPVQFILERDLGAGIWRFGQGIEVSDETIGLEAIEAVGTGEELTYLEADHTRRHYRETWFPRFLYRGVYETDAVEHERERQMLDAAQQEFQDAITRYQPPALDDGKRRDIQRIVAQARKTLLG